MNKVNSAADAHLTSSDHSHTFDSAGGLVIGATDNAVLDATLELFVSTVTSNTNFASDSDAIGGAGAVTFNDLVGGAHAFIDNVTVTVVGGDVVVGAVESSTLSAVTASEAHASGGSQFGGGTVIAVGALIAQFVVERC